MAERKGKGGGGGGGGGGGEDAGRLLKSEAFHHRLTSW